MARIILVVLLATSLWPAAGAQLNLDSLKVGSATYSNVTIVGANATDIFFTHDQGMSSAKLKYLDASLQKRFKYDPKLAAQEEARRAEDEARFRQTLGSNLATKAAEVAKAAEAAEAAGREKIADSISSASLLGKPAPAVQPDKWLGEKPHLDHKAGLVFFWTPSSGPARAYIPVMNGFQSKFGGRLAVVGITPAGEKEVGEAGDPQPQFPCGLDAKQKLIAAAGVTSVPAVLIYDAKGVVQYVGHPAAITEKYLASLLPPE
jgi:hypothetical protein